MVAKEINRDSIESGKRFLKKLDAAGVKVDAAFWFFFSDIEDWKLVLSLPQEIEKGPKKAYSTIQKVYKKINGNLPGLTLSDITVTKRNNPLVDLLRIMIKIGPGIGETRLTHNTINGVFIEDAVVYRLL